MPRRLAESSWFVSFIVAIALFARNATAQDVSALGGTYRVTADQTTVQIPEWGGDCGPRPASHTGASGRQATVTATATQLEVQDGRHHNRTDGCWSDNPGVRRISASHNGDRWTVVCQTPDSDYQHEQGTYTITASGTRIAMHEASEYSWTLRESRCRASATRTLTFERVGAPPVAATEPDAGRAPPPPTTHEPPPNRCASPGAPTRLTITPSRRSLAAGSRVCFRARVFDANQCEVAQSTAPAVSWSLARSGGVAAANDATLEGSCVRAPSSSVPATYDVTATAGSLTDHAVAAVVTVDELHALVAQHFEDEDAGVTAIPMASASGSGVGAVVVVHPSVSSGGSGTGIAIWVFIGLGLVGALAVVLVLARSRSTGLPDAAESRSSVPPVIESDAASVSGRQRREAVPLPARELARAAVEAHLRTPPASAANPAPPADPAERPRVKRCPTCHLRFTAEMAFCPEDGSTLVTADGTAQAATAAPASPPVAVAPSPTVGAVAAGVPCSACGRPIAAGAQFCPYDGTPTPVASAASGTGAPITARDLPLACPQCGKRFAAGTLFCGEDGTALIAAS